MLCSKYLLHCLKSSLLRGNFWWKGLPRVSLFHQIPSNTREFRHIYMGILDWLFFTSFVIFFVIDNSYCMPIYEYCPYLSTTNSINHLWYLCILFSWVHFLNFEDEGVDKMRSLSAPCQLAIFLKNLQRFQWKCKQK